MNTRQGDLDLLDSPVGSTRNMDRTVNNRTMILFRFMMFVIVYCFYSKLLSE